jgi:hypothetical protein
MKASLSNIEKVVKDQLITNSLFEYYLNIEMKTKKGYHVTPGICNRR